MRSLPRDLSSSFIDSSRLFFDRAWAGSASIVLHSSHHVLRPLFHPVISRSPGLRRQQPEFSLPEKDNRNFIPRIRFVL